MAQQHHGVSLLGEGLRAVTVLLGVHLSRPLVGCCEAKSGRLMSASTPGWQTVSSKVFLWKESRSRLIAAMLEHTEAANCHNKTEATAPGIRCFDRDIIYDSRRVRFIGWTPRAPLAPGLPPGEQASQGLRGTKLVTNWNTAHCVFNYANCVDWLGCAGVSIAQPCWHREAEASIIESGAVHPLRSEASSRNTECCQNRQIGSRVAQGGTGSHRQIPAAWQSLKWGPSF